MIKKFCTKHGIEYSEKCPECLNDSMRKETLKNETKTGNDAKANVSLPKPKKPKMKRKPERSQSNENIDAKLKALMEKWNGKK